MRGLVGMALLALIGCEGAVAPGDGGPDAELPLDASVPGDGGGLEASVSDAGPIDAELGDAAARVDSAAADAEPGDSGCPAACEASGECATSACVAGVCVENPVTDGTPCGEMGLDVCVAGACVMRGCGDGYREPGTSSMREGCDDGNPDTGDACSSDCVPTPFLVHADGADLWSVYPTGQGPAVGVDGAGRLLFVWSEDRGGEGWLRARRYSRYAVAEPLAGVDPIPIDLDLGAPPTAHPTVAGLAGGGWVITWTAERMASEDVVYRVMAADGTLGPERVANVERTGPQDEARVASLGDGFVIVWTDHAGRTDDPMAGIRARRFRADGTALDAGELLVATTRTDRQDQPSVASDGDEWLVVWRHRSLSPGEPALIFGRRLSGGTALDTAQFEVSGEDGGSSPAATSLGMGYWAAAWESGGDILARVIDSTSPEVTPGAVSTIAGTGAWESAPSIAPLPGGAYILSWLAGTPAVVEVGASPGASLVPELSILESWLPMGVEGHASVAPAPDGTWFVWAGTDFATGSLGVAAFHLPRD